MTKDEAVRLFADMHPHFFDSDAIRGIPKEWTYNEMLLFLRDFDPGIYKRELDPAVTFGLWQGDPAAIQAAAEAVNPGWGQYYDGRQPIYCGVLDGVPVSFCLIADMGTHFIDGRLCRVGGPACVGTLPAYRDRGIGLTMVSRVTLILREQGFDCSYIHYTGVAPWYEKLGYRTILCWDRDGIL